jgi:hypothetical protein
VCPVEFEVHSLVPFLLACFLIWPFFVLSTAGDRSWKVEPGRGTIASLG